MSITLESHIWACANTLLQQHGNNAWFVAALRADALLEAGDHEGHAMFKAVLTRIETLEQLDPAGSVH